MRDLVLPPIPLSHLGRRPEPEREFRLLERLRRRLRASRSNRKTEEAYVDWARRFVLFHERRHPANMGEAEISAFLNYLAAERKVRCQSWQITPIVLTQAMTDPDPAAAKRASDAMVQMQKIDIAAIEAARRSEFASAREQR